MVTCPTMRLHPAGVAQGAATAAATAPSMAAPGPAGPDEREARTEALRIRPNAGVAWDRGPFSGSPPLPKRRVARTEPGARAVPHDHRAPGAAAATGGRRAAQTARPQSTDTGDGPRSDWSTTQ